MRELRRGGKKRGMRVAARDLTGTRSKRLMKNRRIPLYSFAAHTFFAVGSFLNSLLGCST